MILDGQLQFSSAQAVTAAALSTNYVDLALPRDIGTGASLYVFANVQETLTDGGSNTSTLVSFHGDDETSFTGPAASQDLFSFDDGDVAGVSKIARLDPASAPLNYRYLSLYYAPVGANLTGGAFDAHMVLNVQKYVSYAGGFTVS